MSKEQVDKLDQGWIKTTERMNCPIWCDTKLIVREQYNIMDQLKMFIGQISINQWVTEIKSGYGKKGK